MGNRFSDEYVNHTGSHLNQYSNSNLHSRHNSSLRSEKMGHQKYRNQSQRVLNDRANEEQLAETHTDHRFKLHLELIKEFGDPYRCVAFAGSQATGKTELVKALTRGSRAIHTKTIPCAKIHPAFEILGPFGYIYDLIGASTAEAYSGEYVQHLTGFDAVFIVMGNRISEIDYKIAKFCFRNNIPCYCIRSKTDVDLISIMEEQKKTLEEAKRILSNNIRADFAHRASQSKSIENLLNNLFLVTRKYWTDPKEYKQFEIDENYLINKFKQMSKSCERWGAV